MRFIITLSCWCNAVDSFVKDDYSLALDTGIDIHNSYNRKVWCLSDLEHSVTFISHSAESLLSPHISCPLTQYSGLIPWPQICLGYLFPPLSLSLALPSVGFVTTGGDGENSGPQPFPATAQKIAVEQGAHLSPQPWPLGPSDVGKAWEGVPLSRQSFQAPNLPPQPSKPRQQSSWLMLFEDASLHECCFFVCFFGPVVTPCLRPNRKYHTCCSGSQWGLKCTSELWLLVTT